MAVYPLHDSGPGVVTTQAASERSTSLEGATRRGHLKAAGPGCRRRNWQELRRRVEHLEEDAIAEMEQFFAILQGSSPPTRPTAKQKAAERWGQEAS